MYLQLAHSAAARRLIDGGAIADAHSRCCTSEEKTCVGTEMRDGGAPDDSRSAGDYIVWMACAPSLLHSSQISIHPSTPRIAKTGPWPAFAYENSILSFMLHISRSSL
jgi:hypothetical protein